MYKTIFTSSSASKSLGVVTPLPTDLIGARVFSSVEKREKQMKMDEAVDEIRKRFGFYSVQRGIMFQDKNLSAVNAKADHTIHPRGYFA